MARRKNLSQHSISDSSPRSDIQPIPLSKGTGSHQRSRPSNSKKNGGPVSYYFIDVIQGDPSLQSAKAKFRRSRSRATPDHRWTARELYQSQWNGSTQSHEKISIELHVSVLSGKPIIKVQRVKVTR